MFHVFWSGGLDSSFLMVYLSNFKDEIQPHYLKDHNRNSMDRELGAIQTITEMIRNHPDTKCTILPLITLDIKDLMKDDMITNSWKTLHAFNGLGRQYNWLARYMKSIDTDIYVACEGAIHPTGRLLKCIYHYGDLELKNEDGFEYYQIKKEVSSEALASVFERCRFPKEVFNRTKQQEADDMKRLGYEKALNTTWFCYSPVHGEPCGTCIPCCGTIEDGMQWRFSKAGLRRHKFRWFINKTRVAKRKIKRIAALNF